MSWINVFFLCLGIAIIVYMFVSKQSSQQVATVAVEHQVSASGGDITAIEYFWRPG